MFVERICCHKHNKKKNREKNMAGKLPPAPKGNQRARKLTTPELKKAAYDQYCAHIAKGKPKEAWYFEHPDMTIIWETMEQYIKDFPADFPSINKKMAESQSYGKWFDKGEEMMTSQEKCQPAIYQMIMRNKFGWDKESSADKEARRQGEETMLEAVFKHMNPVVK